MNKQKSITLMKLLKNHMEAFKCGHIERPY